MVIVKAASATPGHGPRWRTGRVALVSMVGVIALLAAACSSGTSPSTAAPNGGPSAGSSAGASASPTASKQPTVSLAGSADSVSFLKPVKFTVADGSFASMQVATDKGQELIGDVSGDGSSWVSQNPPRPASSYRATATVKDASGQTRTQAVTFTVAKVPASQKLSFTVTPDDGETVGIAQPIHVGFLSPVTQKAAIEKAMKVTATTPSGQPVVGSWHWLNSQQVDWRPKSFFQSGTKVTLDMKIAGMKASATRYGRQDYSETFTIGASHVTEVDAKTHRVQIFQNGKLTATWPTGTGRPGLATYSGTYVVLGKSKVVQMDSCSARITCDKKDPDYYNEKEYWATRITASGTFLHAASWDGLLGKANTSHGCVHLSDADAKIFYNNAVVGDVVIVKNTGRGPQERIDTQDPGLYDWNLSWKAWTAGSALA